MRFSNFCRLSVGLCLCASGSEAFSGSLSAEEMKTLKAQIKAEILAEMKAEQKKELAKLSKGAHFNNVKKPANQGEVGLASKGEKPVKPSTPVDDGRYKGYMKSESMNTYYGLYGRVAFNASYANHPTGQGYATSTMFANLDKDAIGKIGTEYRTNEFRCGGKNSRFGFKTVTPFASANGEKEIRTKMELDFCGETDTSEKVTNAYKPRCRYAYVEMGQLLVGLNDSVFNFGDAGMMGSVDVTGPVGETFVRQGQVRYTHKLNDGAEWVTALENPETDAVDRTGDDTKKYKANRSNSLDIIPDLASKFTQPIERGKVFFAGVLRYLRVNHKNNRFTKKVGYGVGGGVNYELTDNDVVTATLRMGNGAGRYVSDGSISCGMVKNVEVEGVDRVDLHKSVASVLTLQHYWDKENQISSNVGLGFAHGWLSKGIKEGGYDKDKKFVLGGLFKTGYSVHVNLIWSPIKDVIDLGTEYAYGDARLTDNRNIIVNRIAFGLTYKF